MVAVLLTVATINTYFAGAAELGASLARDGSLPALAGAARRAPPACPGERSGWWPGSGLVTTAVMAVLGLDTNSALLLTTATFALVYLAGTAAALLLLEGWGRFAAVRLGGRLGRAGRGDRLARAGAARRRCSGCVVGPSAKPARFGALTLGNRCQRRSRALAESAVGAFTAAPLGSCA